MRRLFKVPTPSLKRKVCGGDFDPLIKRSSFDVNRGVAKKFTVDDIKVSIQIEAVKQ